MYNERLQSKEKQRQLQVTCQLPFQMVRKKTGFQEIFERAEGNLFRRVEGHPSKMVGFCRSLQYRRVPRILRTDTVIIYPRSEDSVKSEEQWLGSQTELTYLDMDRDQMNQKVQEHRTFWYAILTSDEERTLAIEEIDKMGYLYYLDRNILRYTKFGYYMDLFSIATPVQKDVGGTWLPTMSTGEIVESLPPQISRENRGRQLEAENQVREIGVDEEREVISEIHVQVKKEVHEEKKEKSQCQQKEVELEEKPQIPQMMGQSMLNMRVEQKKTEIERQEKLDVTSFKELTVEELRKRVEFVYLLDTIGIMLQKMLTLRTEGDKYLLKELTMEDVSLKVEGTRWSPELAMRVFIKVDYEIKTYLLRGAFPIGEWVKTRSREYWEELLAMLIVNQVSMMVCRWTTKEGGFMETDYVGSESSIVAVVGTPKHVEIRTKISSLGRDLGKCRKNQHSKSFVMGEPLKGLRRKQLKEKIGGPVKIFGPLKYYGCKGFNCGSKARVDLLLVAYVFLHTMLVGVEVKDIKVGVRRLCPGVT